MRNTFALALLALAVAAPAGATPPCARAHVVTDLSGDTYAGASADPSGDVLYADLALTQDALDVTLAVADLDAASVTGLRAIDLAFDLGDTRFVVEYLNDTTGEKPRGSAALYTATQQWPVAEDETNTLDHRAPLPFQVNGDTVRVRVSRRILADNDVWLPPGTEARRMRLSSWDVVDASPAATVRIPVDDARRAESYHFEDASCG